MTDPNDSQRTLIEQTDGPYLVDAGPGTGKTFTITRRYANILAQPAVAPEDILLVTFTRNAAGEMRDRIVDHTDYDLAHLQDAPISTFHAYCYRLLRRYGHTAPEYLGIDDQIAHSLDLVEDDVQERAHFRAFISQFEDAHPEHDTILATLTDPTALRGLLGELAAKGVIPTADGWYRESDAHLRGDREAFLDLVRDANEPEAGANGPTQSQARAGVTSSVASDMTAYPPTAPAYDDLDQYPRVNEALVADAFDEDRDGLFAFVHDLYIDYLEFALGRNYLTQSLMLALAFVMLAEDDHVRERVRHEYVMIDEFQDTNELQFKLALLLADAPNICVVGDWKQSIYGFQHTSVENITDFRDRVVQYQADLNRDRERIPFTIARDDVNSIPLTENYRSTESIIRQSEETLLIPATNREPLDSEGIRDDITTLSSNRLVDNSRLEAVAHENELDLVLDRIQHIVGNPDYAVETREEPTVADDAPVEEQRAAEQERLQSPSLSDIAVFTRKHAFARDLIERAQEYDVPLGYEGGLELFDTDQAKLLLAWLRILEADADRGWAVVLEQAGYTLADVDQRLDTGDYPADMHAFRDELEGVETLGGVAQRVFDRYDYHDATADTLVAELTGLYEGSIYSRGEAIDFIERNLHAGTSPDIDMATGDEAVTLQTIHGAKGLEYPIVIMANLNQGAFPHYGHPSGSRIHLEDTLGLRHSQTYATVDGRPHVFDSWQYDVLTGALPTSYDEERRLLYVATTRAKRHLVFTAGDTPSNFFDGLNLEPQQIELEVTQHDADHVETSALSVSVPEADGPVQSGVHGIMDDSVYDAVTEGEGTAFGQTVHDFAEAYALGEDISPSEPGAEEQRQIAAYIDTLTGDLYPEQTVLYPLDGTPQINLTGIIDLLHVDDDHVDIIDYKTDRHRHAHDEYRLQLSIYYHVLNHEYPDREIRPIIYYTGGEEQVQVDPLRTSEIRQRAESMLLAREERERE